MEVCQGHPSLQTWAAVSAALPAVWGRGGLRGAACGLCSGSCSALSWKSCYELPATHGHRQTLSPAERQVNASSSLIVSSVGPGENKLNLKFSSRVTSGTLHVCCPCMWLMATNHRKVQQQQHCTRVFPVGNGRGRCRQKKPEQRRVGGVDCLACFCRSCLED